MKKRFSVALRWFSLLLTIMLMMNSSVNPVYAEVVLNMAVKGSLIEGTTVTLSWNSMDDTDYYIVSLRDLTTDKLLYNRQNVGTKTSFRIDVDLEADHSYRAWVAAIANGSDPAVIPSSHQTQKEFTIKPDVCLHDGETYKDNVEKIYKSISDDEHRVTTTYDLCCYDCDEVLEENQTDVVIDPHDFDENGDCYLCDYTFSCTHKEKDIELDKSAYSVIDEDTHLYFEMGHYVCANANCGKEIEPYYYEEEEEHVFKNNTCRYCGYTKTEPLSIIVARGQQTAFVGDGITASVTTEGGSGSFDYAWEVLCNGMVVDKTDYSMSTSWGYEATKVGEWQFKVYVKDTVTNKEMTAVTSIITVTEAVCAHSNPKEEKGKTEYEKYSDIKHEIIEYYSIVCSDCGEVLSDVNYRSTLEDHAVDASGQCICGYAAPTDICEHTESKPVQIGDPKVEQYDEKWHRVITTYQDVCANDECGVILIASREETEMVVHEYDSEGACLCGYVEPTEKCDHAPNETLTNTEYKEIDENDHEIIRTYHYECECGQVNHDESLTTTEAHNFIAGLCALCGYVQPYIPEVKISGAFGSESYTMTVGETLGISVSASATNANLTRVTVTVDGSGDDDHDHQDITGTEWSGSLTLDGNKHPLNVPGAYTIKLFAKVDAGAPNYAIVDYATVVVTEPEIAISGAFGSDSYTMTVGETLGISISASATNANLTRVTVTVDGSGDDDHDHQDITGTEWNGSLTLDGTKHPLNVPGTYTIKLFAKVDAGDPNYAIVDYATVVVTEPEITISGAFGSESYTMTVGETLGISASASATNANLTRVTVTVDGSGDDDHDHKDISGTEWSGSLTLDGTKHPLNVPGTYTIKLFAKVDAGDPNYAIVDYATVVVTEAPEEPVKPESPVVNVALAGDTMTASWNAVEGAERYVYSLRNLTDDQSIEWHKDADGCMVTAVLEVGKQYKIAVAAVPAGVVDTEAEADKCAWAEVVFVVPSEEDIKLDAPAVNVTVDGVNMTATWTSVEGADRYVYSLYNITDDQRIAVHQTVNNCAATAILDAGKQYRIAVAAVPAFVKDTQAEPEKCSWTEAVFATLSEEELNKTIPGVLSVVSNAADKTLLPGETFTATVICNKYTSDLRVSGAENGSVGRMHIDAYGRNCFDYTASFSANGVYQVRFTAIDPNGIYVENQLYSVVVPVTVCDHTVGEPVLVDKAKAVYANNDEHLIVCTYEKSCICRENVERYPEDMFEKHVTDKSYQYKLEHENGLGHRKYYVCSVCNENKLSGGDHPEKKDYSGYVEWFGSSGKCSVCRNEYVYRQRVKEAQTLLQGLGYNIGAAGVDGILGKDTLAALNAFRADIMGLGAIGYVDNDTLEALRKGIDKENDEEQLENTDEEYIDELERQKEYESASRKYKNASNEVSNIYLVSGTTDQISKQNDALWGISGAVKNLYAGTYELIDKGVEFFEDADKKYEEYVYDLMYNATLASLEGMTQGFEEIFNDSTYEAYKRFVSLTDSGIGLAEDGMDILLDDVFEYAGQTVPDDFSYNYKKWGVNAVIDVFQKRNAAQEEVEQYFYIVQNRQYYSTILENVKKQAKAEENIVLENVCSEILAEIEKEMSGIKTDILLSSTGEWVNDTTKDFVYDFANQIIGDSIKGAYPGWWFVEAAHFVGELANTSGKIDEQENIFIIKALIDNSKESKNYASESYTESDNELFYLCLTGMLHEVGLQSVEKIYGGFQWTDWFNLTDAEGTVKNAQSQQQDVAEALNTAVEAYYAMRESSSY